VLTRLSPDPSILIVKIWSHGTPSRVDWNTSRWPSGEKYASAFSPPRVSWRMFRKCFSAPVEGVL
jgi:hypothetical protein